MRLLLVPAIRAYQNHVSPRKGFRCAYGVATGRWTCSSYGMKIAQRHGALAFLRGMQRQFARCKAAHGRLRYAMATQGEDEDQAQQAEEAARKVRNRNNKSASNWSDCVPAPGCGPPNNLSCPDLGVVDVS